MAELYVVKIEYYLHMKFSGEVVGVDVKLFSSREKAEGYLVDSGFVYGKTYFYSKPCWVHCNCLKPRTFEINRLVSASIENAKVDDDQDVNCIVKCLDFIRGKKEEAH